MTDLPNDLSLQSVVATIEAWEEEKREISQRISALKKEATKPGGLDGEALTEILRERKMPPGKRRRLKRKMELYRAALGMLDGTPLGEAAREAVAKGEPLPETEPADAPTPASEIDVEAARAAGQAAAQEGKTILENPYVAGDPRRAAWDEGWCRHSGSDGMDIPAYLRRAPKKPDGKGGEKPGEGSDGKPDDGAGDE